MDKELQNFIEKAKNIKMPEKDKFLLRSKLSALPVPKIPVKSPYLSKSHISTLGKALVAACLVVVLGGGSLSYAAEKSLPGDLLYPIKTDFNEEVVSVFKITPESKAAWQEKRVERRQKEIEELRRGHKLNDRAKIQVEKNLEKQKKRVEELKNKAKTKGKEGNPIPNFQASERIPSDISRRIHSRP